MSINIDKLSIEILKAKCDLKSSSEEEILKCYLNIYKNLKLAYKEIPKEGGIKVLK